MTAAKCRHRLYAAITPSPEQNTPPNSGLHQLQTHRATITYQTLTS